MKLKALFVCVSLLAGLEISAQTKYWVYFKDKNPSDQPAVSKETLANRQKYGLATDETDLPVRQDYVRQLKGMSVKIGLRSKWLNAVSAYLTPGQVAEVEKLDFVLELKELDPGMVIARTSETERAMMVPVLQQVQSNAFFRSNLSGKGVTIGVIDAGFYTADSAAALRSVFSENRVLGIRDYVKPDIPAELMYSMAESFSDVHGTEVMSAIGGFDKTDMVQYGVATQAKYYLARTDYTKREWRGEEDNWVAAMEWMDSLGVRLINTSLGYAKGFSDPKENYSPQQMDGKTSAISRAAQIAADRKGILLIVSAGNEGEDKSWRVISTPADAKGVLSVGATNERVWTRIGYSSIGPEFLSYLKPNVSCFSLYGTSLSAPVITGFAACLMQAFPDKSNKELFDLIEKSAHLYPYGNNFVGYGVPNATRALALGKAPYLPAAGRLIKASGRSISVPVDTGERLLAAYRKKNERNVISQQIVKVENGTVTLKKQPGEKFTTLDLRDYAIEIAWE